MSILRWVAMGLCVLCALVGLYMADVANQRMVRERERERERGVMASQGERDLSLYGTTQEGWMIPLGSPDDEEGWIHKAQTIADQRKEAIAVVQEGVLIALINPTNLSTNGHNNTK